MEQKVSFGFVFMLLIFLIIGFIGGGFLNLSEGEFLYEGIQLQDNTEKWMTFMSILSTLMATFFIYTGFKIETIKESLVGAKKEVKDSMEFGIQLQYCMSFIIQKQFSKAIDSLEVLRKESFVYHDSEKVNVCNFFLAHCYYEKGSHSDLVTAVDYINMVFEDNDLNPFKLEIIEKFEELDKIQNNNV